MHVHGFEILFVHVEVDPQVREIGDAEGVGRRLHRLAERDLARDDDAVERRADGDAAAGAGARLVEVGAAKAERLEPLARGVERRLLGGRLRLGELALAIGRARAAMASSRSRRRFDCAAARRARASR